MGRTNGYFYAVIAIDDATGREVGWTCRAIWFNVERVVKWFATLAPSVTVTVVKVQEG